MILRVFAVNWRLLMTICLVMYLLLFRDTRGVDCVYLLRMSQLLRYFSTMDLCVSWIGLLDFELSAMLVYTSAKLRDSACLE